MDPESDQEYEQIQEGGWAGKRRNRAGIPQPPDSPGSRYASADKDMLPGMRKMLSAKNDAPPLPAPNVKKRPPPPVRGQTSHTLDRSSRPPPLKPRSMSTDDSSPPDIPPKPGPKSISLDQPPVTSPQPRRKKISDSFIIENDELGLETFVSKFREKLPLHLRVSKGYYGVSDRTSVSEGDAFNVHFIKKTKVVSMVDGGNGVFRVALNSGIHFGVLYNPNDKRDEAINGFIYEKVSDLQLTKALPKVVRVGASWRGSSADSSLEVNELLIIKGWKKKLNGKALKAYNPHTRSKKELAENCQGKFSTRPYDCKLYLSEIMEFLPDPLPCEAVFFVHADSMSDLPRHLISSVMKLKAICTETSLVASNVFLEETPPLENKPVEIPIDLDIEVQVLRPKVKSDTDDLYQTTRELLDNFNRVKTVSYAVDSSCNSESQYLTQAAIYNIVREGSELTGVDIVKPANIYLNLPSPRKNVTSSPTQSITSSIHEDVTVMPCAPPLSESTYSECGLSEERYLAMEERLNRLEQAVQQIEQKVSSADNVDEIATKLSREITSARADMKRLETRGSKSVEDATSARTDTVALKSMVEQLKKANAKMENDLKLLKHQLRTTSSAEANSSSTTQLGYMTLSHQSPVTSSDSAYSTVDEASRETNRNFLATLDCVQVLNLLDFMGLKKHTDAFMEERVNGEILLECDDSVLQEELRITSKLQRVRILKLIQGKYSAENILSGEDPYTYASPK